MVQAAITYAETTNPGAGFWLKLHLQDGRILQGPCRTPEHGIMRMEIYTEEDGLNCAEPVWINLECVSHVQLTW
jgi:hypothetical protein